MKKNLYFIIFKAFILSSLVLAGCMLKPARGHQVQRYTLPQASVTVKPAVSQAKLLIVSSLQTVPWLDTASMAYKTDQQQISYFALHGWAARPADLLQPMIIDALQKTGVYKAVLPATVGMAEGNLRLNMQIIDFEQIFYNNHSVYCITVDAALFSTGKINTARFLRSRRFTVIEPAKANNPQAGVEAAGRAVNKLINELIGFLNTRSACWARRFA